MTTQMHLAAQYLAAAGISFLDKKEDDSHTNLGFSMEKESLFTRPLDSSGITLSLNYTLFILEWNGNTAKKTLRLDGTTHAEVLQWIRRMAKDSGIKKSYVYDLHYELPHKITDDYVFKLQDVKRLKELTKYRKLTQTVIQDFLKNNKLDSEIRIWPHHFDTGAYAQLEDESGIAIGLGLAIPDSMCNDYYLYISGYQGHDSIDTTDFKPLSKGQWKNEGFKGAILPISKINKVEGLSFFKEVFSVYQN